jgi:hypothetical protein
LDRAALENRWKHLTNELLPAQAASRNWPISQNHCFQRVLLDHACGCVWYDVILSRPAYRHAPLGVLTKAIRTAEDCLNGAVDVSQLNRQSLKMRGKL